MISVTFIVLSYARPGNIQRIIDAILGSDVCHRVIVCNNQPRTDLRDYLACDDDRLDLHPQTEEWGPIRRYHLAREAPGDYFISIDDDVFLTSEQINRLAGFLVADPLRPHGVWGEMFSTEGSRMTVHSGVHGKNCEVSVLNCVYAFTKAHVGRIFGYLQALGVENLREIGPGDDILVSRAASLSPLCHDLGEIEFCSSASQEGVARFRSGNFTARRMRLWRRLQQLDAAADIAIAPPFQQHLKRINSVLGETLGRCDGTFQGEGNLFYHHKTDYRIAAPPDASRAHKRDNFLSALRGAEVLLEIGFNAGHSALLALSAYPNLRYLGVDAFWHSYTEGCSDYIADVFGSRFQLLKGDSRELLPMIAGKPESLRLDLIHIDGGHDRETLRQDLNNSLRLCDDYTRILVDDMNLPVVRNTVAEFVKSGRLRVLTPLRGWAGCEQALLAPKISVV